VITSYREEGLYYHPITAPVVITIDEEEWMYYHHFTGQFVFSNIPAASGISYHLREIYSICRCCRDVAKYKWKVHNGKLK
jgi:hypothetical protein